MVACFFGVAFLPFLVEPGAAEPLALRLREEVSSLAGEELTGSLLLAMRADERVEGIVMLDVLDVCGKVVDMLAERVQCEKMDCSKIRSM